MSQTQPCPGSPGRGAWLGTVGVDSGAAPWQPSAKRRVASATGRGDGFETMVTLQWHFEG